MASYAHRTCGGCRCDDASITPSIVIHSHLLDGIVTSVCDLPPFLPASDPRLPNARLGMVLLLHHLESKSFTYRDTQLSRFDDLAAHPLYFTVQFRANGSHTKRAAVKWDSPRFTSIFLASGLSSSQAESRPTHLRLTQAVRFFYSLAGCIIVNYSENQIKATLEEYL